MADAGDLKARMGIENKQFLDALNDATAAVTKHTSESAKQFAQVGDALGQFESGLLALGSANIMTDFIADSLAAQTAVERAANSLTNMGDVAGVVKDALDELEGTSRFDFEQLAPAAKSMLALGVSAGDTAKAMKAVTDTATAFDLPLGAIDNVTSALGKMMQSGEVSEKTIKALVSSNIPAWEILAKTLNTDVAGAQKAVKDGTISAKEAFDALTAGMQRNANAGRDAFVNGWEGAARMLDKTLGDIQESFGEAIIDTLKEIAPLIKSVTDMIANFVKAFMDLPAPVKTFIVVSTALAAVIITVAGAAALLGPALAAIGTALAAAAGPALLLAGLVALGIWIHNNWAAISNAVEHGWDKVASVWNSTWTGIKDTLTGAWDSITTSIREAWAKINSIFEKDTLGEKISSSWALLEEGTVKAWSGMVGAVKIYNKAMEDDSRSTWQRIADGSKSFWENLKDGAIKGAAEYVSYTSKVAVYISKPFLKTPEVFEGVALMNEANAKMMRAAADGIMAVDSATKKAKISFEELAKQAKANGVTLQQELDNRVVAAREFLDLMTRESDGSKEALANIRAAQVALTDAQKKAAEGSSNVVAAIEKQKAATKKLAEEEEKAAETRKRQYEAQLNVTQALNALADEERKKVSTVTGLYSVLYTRFGQIFTTIKNLGTAFKDMGIEKNEQELRNLVTAAEQNLKTIYDGWQAGLKGPGDYQNAVNALAKAVENLNNYVNVNDITEKLFNLPKLDRAYDMVLKVLNLAIGDAKKVSDAFASAGSHTADEFDQMAKDALENYKIIVQGAGTNSRAALEAWLNYLTILRNKHKDHNSEWTADDERMWKILTKKMEEATKEQKTIWDKFGAALKQAAERFGHNLAEAILGFERREFNKQLDEQEADLQESLAERTKDWENYQKEIATAQSDALADYQQALDDEANDLAESLRERREDYEDYVSDINSKIDKIVEGHRREMIEEQADAQEAIDERRQDYYDYADDVAGKIDDLKDKYAESLREETQALQDELEERTQDYRDFIQDYERDMRRAHEDASDNIAEETADTAENIDDRTRDYNRFVEDTLTDIQRVRAKNKGQYSQEEADLELSLKRKKEDLDEYISDQNRDLTEYVTEQKKRQTREEEDLKTSLERRTRDHQQFLDDNQAAREQAQKDYDEGLSRDVGKLEESLEERRLQFEQFEADTRFELEKSRLAHEEEQAAEVAQQQAALTRKTEDYEKAVAEIIADSAEQRAAIEKDYADTTLSLQTQLDLQRDEYEKFVLDITGPGGQLEKLREEHRTIWEDIKSLGVSALQGIATEMLYLAGAEVVGKLMDKLGGVKGILGDIGDLFKGLGKTAGDGLEKALDVPTGVPGAPTGTPGGGGGGGGAPAGGGLMGMVNMITGIGTMISSIVGNFQMAGMNKSLDLIVNHTLRIYNDLAGFKLDAWDRWSQFQLIKDDFINRLNTIADNSNLSIMKYDDMITRLGSIDGNIGLSKDYLFEVNTKLANIRTFPSQLTITVTATGVTTEAAARIMGNQIAQNLSTQLVQTF